MCFDFERVLGAEPAGQGAGELGQRHRRSRRAGAHDLAVDDVERGGRGLHQLGGGLQGQRAQFRRGKARGFAAHHGDARGKSAHASVDAVGLPVHDADGAVIDAERIGADLRHRRLHALAERGDAGDHFDGAVGGNFDAHGVEGAEAAFLHEHGHAGADVFAGRAAARQFALQRVPAGGAQRLVEQQRIVAGVVDDMRAQRVEAERIGHGAFADQVAAADFDPVDADARGDGVEQPLAHEGRSRSGPARDRCRPASCW